jgi:CheY-like chemotaxis protein
MLAARHSSSRDGTRIQAPPASPGAAPDSRTRFVLLLSSLDDEINIDRSALRRIGGLRPRSIRSGSEALRLVRAGQSGTSAFKIDFIVCAEDMPDMRADAFMRSLAVLAAESAHPVPPVMFMAADSRAGRRALANGAAVVLNRPYSTSELAAGVERLRSGQVPGLFPVRSGHLQPGLPDFRCKGEFLPEGKVPEKENGAGKKALERLAPEEKISKLAYGRTGLNLLRQGKLASAEKFLRQALECDPLDLDSALGLACLHKREGEPEQEQRWLHRAGMICLESGNAERASSIFAGLPEKWRGDPYIVEAQTLLLEENFDAACEAFMLACAKTKNSSLHLLLGRACQFTDDPEYFLQEMRAALERCGYADIARKLGRRLLDDNIPEERRPEGFLASFPLLREIVTVASFTLKTWREGEA